MDLFPIKVDLCCGNRKPAGFIGVDTYKTDCVDIIADLNGDFPFKDNSVDLVRAWDAIEHLSDKIHTMNEIYRICKHNAHVTIKVPSTTSLGAFCDPGHVSYWNIQSFAYYSMFSSTDFYKLSYNMGFKGNFYIYKIYDMGIHPSITHTYVIMICVKEPSVEYLLNNPNTEVKLQKYEQREIPIFDAL